MLRHHFLSIALLMASFSTQAAVTDQISISNGFVREVPPNQTISAAFMTLQNDDMNDHQVVSATSSVAKQVELHTHTQESGMMKMRQIPAINIPAGADAALKPGGLHIMLFNVTTPLIEGNMVPLTLKFEDGSEKTLNLPVRSVKTLGNLPPMNP